MLSSGDRYVVGSAFARFVRDRVHTISTCFPREKKNRGLARVWDFECGASFQLQVFPRPEARAGYPQHQEFGKLTFTTSTALGCTHTNTTELGVAQARCVETCRYLVTWWSPTNDCSFLITTISESSTYIRMYFPRSRYGTASKSGNTKENINTARKVPTRIMGALSRPAHTSCTNR